jgi:hypothetical protein
MPFLGAGAMIMDMNNSNTLYVATGHNATGTGYTYDNFSAGIFKSTNAGSTWTPVLGNTLSQQVTYFKLAQQANAPIYVYACSSLGLYLTENGGTWTAGTIPQNIVPAIPEPSNPVCMIFPRSIPMCFFPVI